MNRVSNPDRLEVAFIVPPSRRQNVNKVPPCSAAFFADRTAGFRYDVNALCECWPANAYRRGRTADRLAFKRSQEQNRLSRRRLLTLGGER